MTIARRARRQLATGAAVVGAATALTLAGSLSLPARAAAARTLYVDCSAAAGSGTLAHPFDTLQAASAPALGPGDRLLLRRGTACKGMLAPRGNGAAGEPITIGAYGLAGALPPRIDGGGTVEAAIGLANMSYVTVDGLELTNSGDAAGLHRGVYLTSSTGTMKGITLEHLTIHDVDGTSDVNTGKPGGGIVAWSLQPPGRFANLTIADDTISDVSRQGIIVDGTGSTTRPPATRAWAAASTGLVVSGNNVQRVQGDGIVVMGTVGALVQQNTVRRGNLAGFDFNDPVKENCAAGIWAWNANRTTIEHNEVSNMHYGPSTKAGALNGCDGEAFDVDSNQDGTVVQYNYSHDNDGGFVLLCTADGTTTQDPHRSDVRYNLSVDDNSTFAAAPCEQTYKPSVNNLDGVRMYNNTIVAPTPRVTYELDEPAARKLLPYYGTFAFDDNLVYATAAAATESQHLFECGSPCSHNLFFHVPPPATATQSVTSDPEFVRVGARGTGLGVAASFKLRAGSPANGAGIAIPPSVPTTVAKNFFGAAIRKPPAIGFS
ncbi:MAG TPA: right-handed parallel beta-helix repeat-containing protein [Acidimicrobiia bacterium]|jgi:hypothetical protein